MTKPKPDSEAILHDQRIASEFIVKDKRDRFLNLAACRRLDSSGKVVVASRKKFAKYRQMMANLEHWLDPRCPRLSLGKGTPHAEARRALAAASSQSSVYVMSNDEHIDGLTMDLAHVLKHLSANDVYGTLVVNAAYSTAYYEQCELEDLTQMLSAKPTGPLGRPRSCDFCD